jgi:MFS family permease
MALYMMIFQGGTPVGAPIVGWVGATFGARWTLIGGGAITILGILGAVAVFGWSRGLLGNRPGKRPSLETDDPDAAGEVVAGRARVA